MLRDALSNKTTTLNGALTNASTKNPLVDLFGVAGSARRMSDEAIIELYEKAAATDEESAIILMFYFRDILQGQGERRFFRVLLKHLGETRPEIAKVLIEHVPEFGRWDDLYALVDTPVEKEMFSFMKAQLLRDLRSEHPSLLAKWLKGSRPSSSESKRLMRKTLRAFGLTPVTYRKTLSTLRKRIGIIETQMCKKEWDQIDYSKVPSQAMKQYIRAFGKRDGERFGNYLNSVLSKDKTVESATINAKTLYPHEIIGSLLGMNYHRAPSQTDLEQKALTALWENLPEYALYDTLPVIDVSGSMFSPISEKLMPIHASIGLGLYAAEHMEGEFKNSFITFDSNPKFVEFSEKESFIDRVRKIKKSDWGYSTDLEKVFKLILTRAIVNNVPQEQMPQRILIVSDMEFDSCSEYGETIYENVRKRFKQAGYQLPQVVFWNVDAKTKQYPIVEEDNALILSGYSPVVIKFLYGGELLTPIDLVMEVVNSERYNPVRESLFSTQKW